MKTPLMNFLILSTLGFTSSLVATTASAFELSPMEMEYSTAAGQGSKTFFVENKASSPVAAQIRVYSRSFNSSGAEVRTETQDFLVFPQQVMLGPNEKRAVRVTYKGTGAVAQELAYRLVAEQLPLATDPVVSQGTKVQLKYLLKFVASIYVSPTSGAPKVIVESLSPQGDKLQLNLANQGSKHKTLKGARVLLKSQGRTAELSDEELKALAQINLLPASRVSLLIDRPASLPAGTVDAEVSFE